MGSSRFSYVRYDETAIAAQNAIRASVEKLEAFVNEGRAVPDIAAAIDETKLLVLALEDGRSKEYAIQKMDEQLSDTLVDLYEPDGDGVELFFKALEEVYMWCGKSIRDSQITRTGKIDEQPERTNG